MGEEDRWEDLDLEKVLESLPREYGKEKKYFGAKFDKGKPMMSLVEPDFIKGIAEVMTMGAEKYSID